MSVTTVGLVIFAIGYLAIALEHKLEIKKSATALATAVTLWGFVALRSTAHIREIHDTEAETFEILLFLIAAMALVEVLDHYRLFDWIRATLYKKRLDDRQQFILLVAIAFFLSAVLDNLTTALVTCQIALRFFKGRNLMVTAAGLVIAANAGGAWSPIGDITTIMLWMEHKFEAVQIMAQGLLPSLVLTAVSCGLLYRQLEPSQNGDTDEAVPKLHVSEWLVIGITLSAFALPVILKMMLHLPPFLGLVGGLAVVQIAIRIIQQGFHIKKADAPNSHLEADISAFLKKIDVESVLFFTGILLAVSALHVLGGLNVLSAQLFGDQPSVNRMVTGSVGLGIISSILDNVPLAAIALKILNTELVPIWVLLALTLGTGGSILVIGSAAGIVAASVLEKGSDQRLTFGAYAKIASGPALAGYLAAIGIWALQFFILGWR